MNSTKTRLVFPLLIIGLLVIIGISLSIGRFTVPFDQTVRILGSQILPLETTWTNGMENVIINVRLPRVIAGLIVGAALAASGATYQGIFKNPLVSPDLLGFCRRLRWCFYRYCHAWRNLSHAADGSGLRAAGSLSNHTPA